MMKLDINKMVDNFLSWKLPSDFSPDGGISYEPYTIAPKWRPMGTNLFNAGQAKAMIEAMLVDVVSDEPKPLGEVILNTINSDDKVYHIPESAAISIRDNLNAKMGQALSDGYAEPILFMARNLHNNKSYATSFNEAEARLFLLQSGLKVDGIESDVIKLYDHSPQLAERVKALEAEIAKLREKAIAVIDRWNSPKWKEQAHTAVFIHELRQACYIDEALAKDKQ